MPDALEFDHQKEMVKLINQLSGRHSVWRVFEDFLAMSAISISNAVDWTHAKEREAQYLDIVKRYSKEEMELFPQMLAHLTEELERHMEHPIDVLGPIYQELEINDAKYNKQIFTPHHICDTMGLMTLADGTKGLEKQGHESVADPCCGSGAMTLGFAYAFKEQGYNYQRQMVVTATDIDMRCVYMAYLQFSLYGIPAVVIHGNTLTVEEWSRWYTPVYMLDGWVWRQSGGNLNKRYPEDEAIKRASEPAYAAVRALETLIDDTPKPEKKAEYDVKLNEARGGQLSFDL